MMLPRAAHLGTDGGFGNVTFRCCNKAIIHSAGSMGLTDLEDEALLFSPDLQPSHDKQRSSSTWSHDSRNRHQGKASCPFSKAEGGLHCQATQISLSECSRVSALAAGGCSCFTFGKTSRSFHKIWKSNPNPRQLFVYTLSPGALGRMRTSASWQKLLSP